MLVGDAEERVTQALVRSGPLGVRLTRVRRTRRAGPAARGADGCGHGLPRRRLYTLLSRLELADAEFLGPVPVGERRGRAPELDVRAVVRVPRTRGAALARALSARPHERKARAQNVLL